MPVKKKGFIKGADKVGYKLILEVVSIVITVYLTGQWRKNTHIFKAYSETLLVVPMK